MVEAAVIDKLPKLGSDAEGEKPSAAHKILVGHVVRDEHNRQKSEGPE